MARGDSVAPDASAAVPALARPLLERVGTPEACALTPPRTLEAAEAECVAGGEELRSGIAALEERVRELWRSLKHGGDDEGTDGSIAADAPRHCCSARSLRWKSRVAHLTTPPITPGDLRSMSSSEHMQKELWRLRKLLNHFATQGHASSVTSVALTADMKNVLSGSDDRSMRLWQFNDEGNAYALRAVITLHDAISAVQVSLSEEGTTLCFGGTCDGCLFVWDSGKQSSPQYSEHAQTPSLVERFAPQCFEHVHCGSVTGIEVLMKDARLLADPGCQFIATCGGKEAKVLKLQGEVPYDIAEVCRCEHEGQTLGLRHLDPRICRASLAVCAEDAVYLWSSTGALLKKLVIPGARLHGIGLTPDDAPGHGRHVRSSIRQFSGKLQAARTLLMAAATDCLGLWVLEDLAYTIRHGDSNAPEEPHKVYNDHRDVRRVEVTDENANFCKCVRGSRDIEVFKLQTARTEDSFHVGDEVSCRDEGDSSWLFGTVVSVESGSTSASAKECKVKPRAIEISVERAQARESAATPSRPVPSDRVGRAERMRHMPRTKHGEPQRGWKYGHRFDELQTRLFATPGYEQEVTELWHEAEVTAMHCAYRAQDDAPSWADKTFILSGTRNGRVCIWDLDGHNIGELHAAMRSLTNWDILFPLGLKMVSAMQVMSFAFQKRVPWPHGVQKAAVPGVHVLSFNFLFVARLAPEHIFWLEEWLTEAVMGFFVLCALGDVPRRVNRWSMRLKARNHAGAFVVGWMSRALGVFFKLVSSVFVVTFSTNMANALECDHGRLLHDTEVACWQGPHLWLLAHLVPIYLLFSFFVIPYVVVQGDYSYVQTEELLQLGWWRRNAVRQATSIHLGPLHPMGENVFSNALTEYLVKLSLPLVANAFPKSPLPLTLACALISSSWLAVAFVRRPFLERAFLEIIVGTRAVAAFMNWCAVLVVLTGWQYLCMAVLLGGSAIILLTFVRRAANSDFSLDTREGCVCTFTVEDAVTSNVATTRTGSGSF